MTTITEENASQISSLSSIFTSDPVCAFTVAPTSAAASDQARPPPNRAAPLAPAPALAKLKMPVPMPIPNAAIRSSSRTYSRGAVLSNAETSCSSHVQFPSGHPTLETTGKQLQQDPKPTTSNYGRMITRSGKWTPEEEDYADMLIELFELGRVDEFEHHDGNESFDDNTAKEGSNQSTTGTFKITNGMTLRSYLSRKLFCSPMRISKKFAGRGIGKLVYMSQRPSTFADLQQQQQLGFPSGMLYNQGSLPLPPAVHWEKLNRLKQAEMRFLSVAFPHGGPLGKKTPRQGFLEGTTPQNIVTSNGLVPNALALNQIPQACLQSSSSPNEVQQNFISLPNNIFSNNNPNHNATNHETPSTSHSFSNSAAQPQQNQSQDLLQSQQMQRQQMQQQQMQQQQMPQQQMQQQQMPQQQMQQQQMQQQQMQQQQMQQQQMQQQQMPQQQMQQQQMQQQQMQQQQMQQQQMPQQQMQQQQIQQQQMQQQQMQQQLIHQQRMQQQQLPQQLIHQQQIQQQQQQQQQIQQQQMPQQLMQQHQQQIQRMQQQQQMQQQQMQQQQEFNNNSMRLHQKSNVSNAPGFGRKHSAPTENCVPNSPDIIKSSEPYSQHGNQKPQQQSPISAAPRLLSPKPEIKVAHNDMSIQPIFPVLDGSITSQLQELQRQKQKTQKQNKSQIERLEEAYLSSVSPNKFPMSKVDNTHGKMISHTSPLPLDVFTAKNNIEQSHSNQKTSTVPMRIPYVTPALTTSGNDTKPIEFQMKISSSQHNKSTDVNRFNNMKSLEKTNVFAGVQSSQMTIDSTKLEIVLPNFLLGFEKVTKQNQNDHLNPCVTNNSADDLEHSAQFSPAYHTSKSFDDFHRFLGKGLPHENETSSKLSGVKPGNGVEFADTKDIGLGIPSIDSYDGLPTLILQKRTRRQQGLAPGINKTDATSLRCDKIKSNEMLLSDAYQEAIKTFASQSAPQSLAVPSQNTSRGSDQCNMFAQTSATARIKFSADKSNQQDRELQVLSQRNQQQQQQQQQSDGRMEFENVFEDCGSLNSSDHIYGTFDDRAAIVTSPSDYCASHTGPNSVGGSGEGTSDDSIGTYSEVSSRYKKRKLEA